MSGIFCDHWNYHGTVVERISKNHYRMMAERISKIGSGLVPDSFGPEKIILVQDWFGRCTVLAGCHAHGRTWVY